MSLNPLLPDLPGCSVAQVSQTEESIVIPASALTSSASCPDCQQVSSHVHSTSIRPLTKGSAIFRASCPFATARAKVPLCQPDVSPNNVCRTLSSPNCSSCSANLLGTTGIT